MKKLFLIIILFVVFVAFTAKSDNPKSEEKKAINHVVFKNGLDKISIIGATKDEIINILGQPEQETANELVYHKKYGYQFAFLPDSYKIYGYTIFSNKKVATVKGISIGDSIKKVVSKYGKYAKEEESPTYFSGDELNVLYHNKQYDLYKILYEDKISFFFNTNKKVQHIFIGIW